MLDNTSPAIQPVPPVGGARPVQPIQPQGPVVSAAQEHSGPSETTTAAAATGGGLRAAYSQFVVNPDTQDVIIRVRDSNTDEVLHEYPSPEVEAIARYLKTYQETLTRHRAALRSLADS